MGFEEVKFFSCSLCTFPAGKLVGLPVEDNQVASQEVEPREMLASALGVKNVVKHNIRSAAGVLVRAPRAKDIRKIKAGKGIHANLSDTAVLAKQVIHVFGRYLVRKVPHKQYPVHFGRKAVVL